MKRRIDLEDIVRLRTVSNAQISPDGGRIAFTVRTVEDLANRSHLWLSDMGQVTHGKANDTGHRWSPDGRWIAFVRSTEEGSQIFVLPTSGGEARALTELEPGSAGAIDWAPDGIRLAFTYRAHPRFAGNKKDPKVPVARHITELWHKVEAMGYCSASVRRDGRRTGGGWRVRWPRGRAGRAKCLW
jgi:dipeptidyl aminopeptidase/acylaminoacyl peptidase